MGENNMSVEQGQTTAKEPEVKPATPRKAAEYKGPWTPPLTPPDKRNFIQRKWKQIALTAAGLVGLAGSIYGVHEANQPEPIPITDTFDASAKDAYITSYNSVQMTFDEYDKLAPPLWETDSKSLTIPLPIKFRDNRTPSLHITKSENMIDQKLNSLIIDGLEQGDIIFSPFDGEIQVSKNSKDDLSAFFIYAKDAQGNNLNTSFATTGLNPLIDFERPIENFKSIHLTDGFINIPIKKGDPIGSLATSDKHWAFAGQIKMSGNGPLLENFNLATTPEGKVTILK